MITNPSRMLALRPPTSRGPPSEPRGSGPSHPAPPQGFRCQQRQPIFNDFQSCLKYAHGFPLDPPSELPASPWYPRSAPKVPQGPLSPPQGPLQDLPELPRTLWGPPRYHTGNQRDRQGPPEDSAWTRQRLHGAPWAASAPQRPPQGFNSCSGGCQIST